MFQYSLLNNPCYRDLKFYNQHTLISHRYFAPSLALSQLQNIFWSIWKLSKIIDTLLEKYMCIFFIVSQDLQSSWNPFIDLWLNLPSHFLNSSEFTDKSLKSSHLFIFFILTCVYIPTSIMYTEVYSHYFKYWCVFFFLRNHLFPFKIKILGSVV